MQPGGNVVLTGDNVVFVIEAALFLSNDTDIMRLYVTDDVTVTSVVHQVINSCFLYPNSTRIL